MDRRLGRPLPCQLANPTRVHLIPPEFFTLYHAVPCAYAVLAAISNCYPPVWGRLPTRYSPVRHSVTKDFIRRICPKRFVRLACVKHAASVHPEPGSNSLNKCAHQDFHVLALMKIVRSSSRTCSARFAPGQNQLLANLSLLLFFKDLSIVRFYDFKKNFRGMCFTVQLSKIGFALPFVSNSFAIISCRFLPVKNFFSTFLKLFLFLSCSNFDILSHPTGCCQELFYFFLTALWSLRDLSDATLIWYHRRLDLSTSFYYFSCDLFIRVNHYISDSFLMFIKR